MKMFQFDAAVDRHVVDALLGLVLDHVQKMLRVHVFDVTTEFFQHLVDRHGSDRHRTAVDDLPTNVVDVLAGRQIHHGVGAVVNGRVQFFQFLAHIAGDGAVADIGVDFALSGDADAHRFKCPGGMDPVGRDHHSTGGHFLADRLDRQVFTLRAKLHLGGNLTIAGGQNLRFAHAIGAPSGKRRKLPRLKSKEVESFIRASRVIE